MKDKVNKLTGEKVSGMMMELLERCSRDEYVSVEEFEQTPEIKIAELMKSQIVNTQRVAENCLYKVDQKKLRENIVNELLSRGSALIDKDGKVNYNGVVEQNGRLDIVIGLPASGKSSAIVDVLSEEFHSRLVDNDEAKELLPDFNNGWGAELVHPESKKISNKQFERAVSNHDNIILPKVGGDTKSLMKYVDMAIEEGYEVYVHYVSLSRQKALGRMINRFLNTGRFLPPKLINDYDNKRDGNKIERTYEELKKEGKINGFSKWNNDVGFGEKPILIEVTGGCRGEFIRSARTLSVDAEKIQYRYGTDTERYQRSGQDGSDNGEQSPKKLDNGDRGYERGVVRQISGGIPEGEPYKERGIGLECGERPVREILEEQGKRITSGDGGERNQLLQGQVSSEELILNMPGVFNRSIR